MLIQVLPQQMLNIKHIAQDEPHICALVTLKMGLAHRGKSTTIRQLKKKYCDVYNYAANQDEFGAMTPRNIKEFPATGAIPQVVLVTARSLMKEVAPDISVEKISLTDPGQVRRDVITAICRGQAVIFMKPDGPNSYKGHSVILVGYNLALERIYYNDPLVRPSEPRGTYVEFQEFEFWCRSLIQIECVEGTIFTI